VPGFFLNFLLNCFHAIPPLRNADFGLRNGKALIPNQFNSALHIPNSEFFSYALCAISKIRACDLASN
jgi:hypothetical protein